jgi:hypothetical protein
MFFKNNFTPRVQTVTYYGVQTRYQRRDGPDLLCLDNCFGGSKRWRILFTVGDVGHV